MNFIFPKSGYVTKNSWLLKFNNWSAGLPSIKNAYVGKGNKIVNAVKKTEKIIRNENGNNNIPVPFSLNLTLASTILNSVESIIFLLDLKGHILFINKAAETLTGYKPSEVNNNIFLDLFVKDEEKYSVKGILADLKNNKSPISFQKYLKTKTHQIHLINWNISSASDKNGMIEYIIVSGFVDSTAEESIPKTLTLKEEPMETEIFQKESIEALMKEKSADQIIREQKEELLKVNQELDRFVYSTSHDLRAPLTSVLGLFNLMREEQLNDNLSHYVSLAEKSIGRLDKIIRNILHYSKNNRIEVVPEEIDLKELISEIFESEEFAPEIDKMHKNVHLEQQYPFFCDKQRLKAILENLISNSINYCDKNKDSKLEIAITVTSDEATIIVEDNGIGIPSDFHCKIFNMFCRATDRSNGAGLGLYIVKESLNKLGGTIDVQSEVDEGTIFTIVLPNTCE